MFDACFCVCAALLQGGGAALCAAEALPVPAALLRTLAAGRLLQSRTLPQDEPQRLVYYQQYNMKLSTNNLNPIRLRLKDFKKNLFVH